MVAGVVSLLGVWRIFAACRLIGKVWPTEVAAPRYPRLQITAWIISMLGVIPLASTGHWLIALIVFVIGLTLPLRNTKILRN